MCVRKARAQLKLSSKSFSYLEGNTREGCILFQEKRSQAKRLAFAGEKIESEPCPCSWKWGAHASGVWFAASRRKLSATGLNHQTVGRRGQRRDAVGSTRDACAPHSQLNCYG